MRERGLWASDYIGGLSVLRGVMKVRLIKHCHAGAKGDVLEPEIHEVGRLLIQRGLAELVEEPEIKPRPKIKLQEWVKKPEAR